MTIHSLLAIILSYQDSTPILSILPSTFRFFRFNFSREFALGPRKSIKNAHVVAVMHDVSHRLLGNKLNKKLITLLNNYSEKPAVLILNKVNVKGHAFLHENVDRLAFVDRLIL